MSASRRRSIAWLAIACLSFTIGCAMAPRKPVEAPLPSGNGQWQGRPEPFRVFAASGLMTALSPDDQLAFQKVANPDDEVWEWRTPLGQRGYAVVRDGKVLAVAVTAFGLNQRR